MTDLRQKAERIAKKHGFLVHSAFYGPIPEPRAMDALEEMAAEVRREAIEECVSHVEQCGAFFTDKRDAKAMAAGLRALLPAAQKEEIP